jgi:predicted acylesterase/phospholipase RssA
VAWRSFPLDFLSRGQGKLEKHFLTVRGFMFRILSIDGGGFRGVYPAHVLKRIEEELNICVRDEFDLIAGTSTGSIIAGGIANGVSPREITAMYESKGSQIFKKRWLARLGLAASRYRRKSLQAIVTEVIGNTKLGEIDQPLIIPATDVGNGCVHVFKSSYDEEFVRDNNVLLRDAILASCAAPTYFDPIKVDKYLLADGGVWANCPAMVAVIDAKKRLGVKLDDIQVLSIGTGISNQYYDQSPGRLKSLIGWGFATRWGRGKFIDMILNLQSQTANSMVGLLLRPEQVLRINFDSDTPMPLDDPNEYSKLVSRADKDFTHNASAIRQFLRAEPIKSAKAS